MSVEAEGAAFSPDGKLLATGGQYGAVRIWDLASGQQVRALNGHAGWVMSLAFSPDGRTLAAGNWRNVRPVGGEHGPGAAPPGGTRGRRDGAGLRAGRPHPGVGRQRHDGAGLGPDRPAGNGKLRPADPSPRDLELAWTDLRGNDAARAYSALWLLAAAPKQALPLLREALPLAKRIEAERIDKLIVALDDDDFEKREKATEDLARMGEQIGPA